MKKIIITLFLLLGGILTVLSQDINTVFITVPDDVILGLELEDKETLLSNPTDTIAVVETKIYEGIKREAIGDDFISLRLSDAGTLQVKLLPLVNDSKIICVVRTACAPACDSQISFYTLKWVPISQGELAPGKYLNWFLKEGVDILSDDFKNVYAVLDMNPMKYTLSGDNGNLLVDYDIEKYLSTEEYKNLEPFLTKQPKVLTWDKTSFK